MSSLTDRPGSTVGQRRDVSAETSRPPPPRRGSAWRRRGRLAALATSAVVAFVLAVAVALGLGSGPADRVHRSDHSDHSDHSDRNDRSDYSEPIGQPGTRERLERGAYLARVGNCAGCHTAPGGAAYAGGRGIETPFGTAYAGNLTPDPVTGIGHWSADDFWQALHLGRGRDGRRLIPAFPYTAYTRVTRDDSDALFAWLGSLAPVSQRSPAQALRFPFGTQWALTAWQWLYFQPGSPAAATSTAAPADDTALLERGDYLVNGLGHCGACHAPRNRWGASAPTLGGGEMPAQGWYAPSLHPVAGDPSTRASLVTLLKTGRNAHTSVSGPMAGVVMQSTQHWRDADLAAAAAYLQSLAPGPALSASPGPALPASPAPSSSAAAAPASASRQAGVGRAGPASASLHGEALYAERCADCHGRDGRGVAQAYPPLAGNPTVLQADPRNLVRIVQHGVFGPTTAAWPRPYGMPPQDLDDADMAAVLTYVRRTWGNEAAGVTAVDVLRLR